MSTSGPPATYERRIVTVLFADLVGFTALGERLDPEDVAAIQDRYFEAVREAVGRYRGVLEKFIGDAAMAAFGVAGWWLARGLGILDRIGRATHAERLEQAAAERRLGLPDRRPGSDPGRRAATTSGPGGAV